MRYVLTLCCVLAVGLSLMFSGLAWGAESDSAESFNATDHVADYFIVLYTDLLLHYRTKAILEACNHKPEARVLGDRIIAAERRRLDAMLTAGIDDRSLQSMTVVKVTDAGARMMTLGYTLGYREGMTVLINSSPEAKTAMCAQGWKHRNDVIPETLDVLGLRGRKKESKK